MQRQKLLKLLISYCNIQECKTFSLAELNKYYENYDIIEIGGKTPQATIRRLLQELRNEKLLSFLPEKGFYTLGGENLDFLLEKEKQQLNNIDLSKETDKEKVEYIRETYFRNTKIIKLAKKILGSLCLYPKCDNTFLKEDKILYIEIHHIIPLYKNGMDRLENLSVVCAHHHKMAHFANSKTRIEIEKTLTKETKYRL